MVIYQKRILQQPVTERKDITRPQAPLNPDQLDILYCTAKETDDFEGFMDGGNDE